MYKWDALLALKTIQAERVTQLTAVPTMHLELVQHPKFDEYDTSTLQMMASGGAPPPSKLGQMIASKTKRAKAQQGYGLTETNAIMRQ